MTVSQLLEFLSAAFPAFNASAAGAWAPVFRARLVRHEGPNLAKAYADVLGSFTVKGSKSLFPVPADFEAHLPNLKRDMGKDEAGKPIDLAGRKRRADSLFANWRAGQGTRASKGNPALMRALEDMARPLADILGWNENPEPLVLTRDQLKIVAQRAISFERMQRYGQPPRDPAKWWEQIQSVAAGWDIHITPEWWDKETAATLTNPEGHVSRVERVRALRASTSELPPPPTLEMKISLLKAAIAFQRDMGFVDIAEAKERELAALEAQLQGEAA